MARLRRPLRWGRPGPGGSPLGRVLAVETETVAVPQREEVS